MRDAGSLLVYVCYFLLNVVHVFTTIYIIRHEREKHNWHYYAGWQFISTKFIKFNKMITEKSQHIFDKQRGGLYNYFMNEKINNKENDVIELVE